MRLFLLCLALVSFASSVAAQPRDAYSALKGGWDVAYRDTKLGMVRGRAYFDTEISFGTVTFQLPGGTEQTLKAQSITAQGNVVRIVWTSDTKTPAPPFDPFGKPIKATQRTMRLGLGDASTRVVFMDPEPVDGTVTSELVYYPKSGTFGGVWGQRVDAVTGASGGAQRTGFFTHGDARTGGGLMAEEEFWKRPQPRIKDTFVIRNQFAMGLLGPAYPYPFKNGQAPDEFDTRRYVFIYGKNLPQRRGEGITLVSDDPAITYYTHSLKSSYDLDRVDTLLRDQAFEVLERIVDRKKPPYTREPGDDFLIIEAKLKPGVKPGFKGLTINGVPTAWTLRFGDHRARLGFARDLTLDLSPQLRAQATFESELTDLVYAPEALILELNTQVDIPLNDFTIILGKNGKPLKLGDARGIKVVKQTAIGSPKVYRSEPFYVIQPGSEKLYPPGAITIPAKKGDSLHLALDGPQVLNLVDPKPSVRVLETPADILTAIQGPTAPRGLQWRGAILKAAQCAGIDGASGMSSQSISREVADTYRNMNVGTIWSSVETILKTRINVGEHAGAIVMQPIFVAMMEAALATYSAPLSDDGIAGLRRTLAVEVTDGDHPLSRIVVKTKKGKEMFLSTTFYDDVLEEKYKLRGEARHRFQIQAMRDARKKLAANIKSSLEDAKETDLCDVKDMLYLTGPGMEDVRARTHAALMKRKTITETYTDVGGAQVPLSRSVWVANRQARARVSNVALYAQTLKAQEKLSDEYWDAYFMTVSLLSLPIGMVGEALAIESVVVATALMDAGDLVLNVLQEGAKQYAEEVELDFARGASVVIGNQRLRQAELDDSSDLVAVFKLLASAAQAANGLVSRMDDAVLYRSVQRGHKQTKKLFATKGSKIDAFRKLGANAQEDVLNAAFVAATRQQDLGKSWLDAAELRALILMRALRKEGLARLAANAPTRPQWASALSEGAWRRLGDMAIRADVAVLVRQNPSEMNKLLMDDDALDILRLPQRDVATFKRAVARQKKRAPTRGPEFVDQARAANGNPEGLFFDTQLRPEVDGYQTVRTHVYAGQSPSGTRYGTFIRGRLKDPVFNTGKDMFVFDVAQAYRYSQPDELVARAGRFQPGNPQIDLTGIRPSANQYARGGPRWVYDVKVPLRDDAPGVPFVMFANFRSFTSLGFKYADPNVGGIMLKNVASANTAGQLAWLRYTYPGKSVDELFRYTTSFKYAQNTAQQLGFRISEVKVSGAVPGSPGYVSGEKLESLVNGMWFDPGNAKTFQELQAARQAFLDTYSLPGNPDTPICFDVYLKFEPR